MIRYLCEYIVPFLEVSFTILMIIVIVKGLLGV